MSVYRLVAWAGQRRVGVLTYRDHSALFAFDYDPDWSSSSTAYPISPALPFNRPAGVSDERHALSVRRFFENLLPEGKALDDAAAVHKVSKANLYALLRVLGGESTGAISLLPEGMAPAEIPDSRRAITHEELSARIRDRANQPFNIWDGRVRMSIAGHQDKLAVYLEEQHPYLVEGRLASTHILKPEPLSRKLPHLVANEHFCMGLAAKLGLPSAPVEIRRVPEPVLMVERFDRRRRDAQVERLHVIDACQSLDLGVSHKYERNFGSGRDVAQIRDGVSCEKLFSVARRALSEAATRMGLLRWVLVQYLIGNSDAHGKNLSFFVEPGGLRLAPAYDLVAVAVYPEVDHELAMGIGDVFELTEVRAFDWADFADRCGVDRRLLVREMRRAVKVLRKELPTLRNWCGYSDAERQLNDRIADFTLRQAERLERDAALLVDIVID